MPNAVDSTGRPAATAASEPGGIAGYQILEELGHGGMGVVYKAQQLSLNRIVALKMVRPGPGASRDDLASFRTEAEAAARLQHPNIVQIYEVAEQDGRPYLVLEFVDGGSLEQKLAGTPLPLSDAAGLVETVARAMHAASTRHRSPRSETEQHPVAGFRVRGSVFRN